MTNYKAGQTATVTADTTLYAVWRGIPTAQTWKIWSGGESERFTHSDMMRVEGNVTALTAILSEFYSVEDVSYQEVGHASQFRYDEALKLERQIADLAAVMGVSVTTDELWSAMKSVSYVDFERWELAGWTVYRAMGGTADRTPAS